MSRLKKLYLSLGEIMVGFWKQTIDWGVVLIMHAVFEILKNLEQEFAPILKPAIDKAKATGKVPPELDALLGELTDPKKPIAAFLGMSAGAGATGGLISSTLGPWLKLLEYEILKLALSARFDPQMAMAILHRRPDLAGEIKDNVKDQGWSDTQFEAFIDVSKAILGPQELVRLRRIYGWTEKQYKVGMAKHGYDADEAEAHFLTTQYYPTPQELVLWQAREVFEKGSVEKYKLLAEIDALDRSAFYKAGMDDKQIENHWAAHWQHASYTQMVEMLRRELITEQDFKDWFKLVEVSTFWRNDLLEIAYVVPTRVDTRRFWDYRTIDPARLEEIYKHLGYRGKNLEDYILWTKVYTAFPDLMARYRNGWISLDAVRSELLGYGMDATRLEELIQTKVAAAAPERTAKERDLTKTDIFKGVKKGSISRTEDSALLRDMGYDLWESEYLIEINVPTGTDEPETLVRELSKGDIKAALKRGQISAPEALSRLVAQRHTNLDAALLVETWLVSFAGKQEEADRVRTRGDVIKAVKKLLASREEGYEMLLAIGYVPDEAKFILEINVEEEERSPESLQEFRAVTQSYRRMIGQSHTIPSLELIAAEREVKRLQALTGALVAEENGSELVAPVLGELAEAESIYRKLLLQQEKAKQK